MFCIFFLYPLFLVHLIRRLIEIKKLRKFHDQYRYMMEDSKIAHKTLPFIQLFLHDHPCMYGNHQNRNVSNARIHEMDPMSPHFEETRDEILSIHLIQTFSRFPHERPYHY